MRRLPDICTCNLGDTLFDERLYLNQPVLNTRSVSLIINHTNNVMRIDVPNRSVFYAESSIRSRN